MSSTAEPQTSIYERVVEDTKVEAALEARLTAKEAAGLARKAYTAADDEARALLAGLDLGDEAPVRIGRFVVVRRSVAARHVSFETDPSSRLTIGVAKTA